MGYGIIEIIDVNNVTYYINIDLINYIRRDKFNLYTIRISKESINIKEDQFIKIKEVIYG